jgi:hypothetical protein
MCAAYCCGYCCGTLAGLGGGLMGMKRVSPLLGAGAFDARKMASKRNIKISDSIGVLPGSSSSRDGTHIVGANAWGKSA